MHDWALELFILLYLIVPVFATRCRVLFLHVSPFLTCWYSVESAACCCSVLFVVCVLADHGASRSFIVEMEKSAAIMTHYDAEFALASIFQFISDKGLGEISVCLTRHFAMSIILYHVLAAFSKCMPCYICHF